MGFFDVLKNLATDKPGFEPPSDSGSSQSSQGAQGEGPATSHQSIQTGPKQIPRVSIERVQCHNNGSNMRAEAIIQNDSQTKLFFDRIFIMTGKIELDRELSPGQEWEFTVYNGPRPNNQNYTKAKIEFRDETNDYFAALFTVDYKPEQDGTYSIERFFPAGQQDI